MRVAPAGFAQHSTDSSREPVALRSSTAAPGRIISIHTACRSTYIHEDTQEVAPVLLYYVLYCYSVVCSCSLINTICVKHPTPHTKTPRPSQMNTQTTKQSLSVVHSSRKSTGSYADSHSSTAVYRGHHQSIKRSTISEDQ